MKRKSDEMPGAKPQTIPDNHPCSISISIRQRKVEFKPLCSEEQNNLFRNKKDLSLKNIYLKHNNSFQIVLPYSDVSSEEIRLSLYEVMCESIRCGFYKLSNDGKILLANTKNYKLEKYDLEKAFKNHNPNTSYLSSGSIFKASDQETPKTLKQVLEETDTEICKDPEATVFYHPELSINKSGGQGPK